MEGDNKTLSKPEWFYCFVYIDLSTHQAHFFILSSVFVVDNLKAQHDLWKNATNRLAVGYEEFPAGFCIGVDATATYSMPIPLEAEYKDRWDLLTY